MIFKKNKKIIYTLSYNEIKTLEGFISILPTDIIKHNENPYNLDLDFMIYHEELTTLAECLIKNIEINKNNFVLKEDYYNKLISLTEVTDDYQTKLYAQHCLLTLQIIKKHL